MSEGIEWIKPANGKFWFWYVIGEKGAVEAPCAAAIPILAYVEFPHSIEIMLHDKMAASKCGHELARFEKFHDLGAGSVDHPPYAYYLVENVPEEVQKPAGTIIKTWKTEVG